MDKKGIAGITIIGGLVIFGVKLYAYWISGSIALLSDALESIVNILASLMMFVCIVIAERPPDGEHHYGHEKIESISSFVEGVLVIIAGLLIIREAYGRFFTPAPLGNLDLAIVISLFATAMNGLLSWTLMKKSKETGSIALEGDATHLFSDVVSSGGVAIGLVLASWLDMIILDPVLAVLMGLIIIKMGIELILKAGHGLMDKSAPEEEKELRVIMDRHQSRFVDYHDLKTRKSGVKVFAELHLSLDGALSVQEAHDFTDHLEEDVKNELPEVELTIHIEPQRK